MKDEISGEEYLTSIDVPDGRKVQLLLKDPGWTDSSGNLFVDPSALEWADTDEEWVMPLPHMCEHIETICSDCLNTWQIDWYIRIVKISPERTN